MRPFLASFYRLFLALGFTGISLSAPCLPAVDAVEADSPPVEVRADPPQYDWAKLHASARVIQVSSGAKAFAFRMIDNDERTAFHFSKADLHPTVIVELAQGEDLTRVKALFDAEAAQVDVYLSNQLPKDAGDFGFLRPVASVVDVKSDGQAMVDFDPRHARYVILRWTRKGRRDEPFNVSEISAFGGAAPSFVFDPVAMLPGQPLIPLPVIPPVSP